MTKGKITDREKIIDGIKRGTYCPECGRRFTQTDINGGRHVSNKNCLTMVIGVVAGAEGRKELAEDARRWAKRNPPTKEKRT